MHTVVVDIGGTNVKVWKTGESDKVKFPSGKKLTPDRFVEQVTEAIADWKFDRVSIGFPGDVLNGRPNSEPYNLGGGWVGFDFAEAFRCPLRMMNDAAMQALGSYEGGRMLYLGFGTSVGTTFITDGKIVPLALGHLWLRPDVTFEQALNRKALESLGVKKWRQNVDDAATTFHAAFLADYTVIGGGNAKKLKKLPKNCRLGSNQNAYFGGLRMWEDAEHVPSLPPAPDKSNSEPEPKSDKPSLILHPTG